MHNCMHLAPHHFCLLRAITMIYGLIPSALSFSPFYSSTSNRSPLILLRTRR
ncbi:hypothetical protein M426DRAFT_229885 [Hypoxylon sp. CI-4A]|nr:hypothetical protein M426DRAFT_229885 [Hypoxylon sp. CI-4A]